MNHILVTTDFSDTAKNALEYAVQLARKTKAAITLFNVYQLPVLVSEGQYVPSPSLSEIEDDNIKLLERLQKEVLRTAPELHVDIVCKPGSAATEIIHTAKATRYDLVVMGIETGGVIAELLGSTATTVASKAKIPVLIIPSGVRFSEIHKIVFAFDYDEVKNPRNIESMIEFSKLYGAKIHVLNIIDHHYSRTRLERALVGMQIHDLLIETEHKFSYKHEGDIVNGIETYLDFRKGDLLVMIKREHGFIYNLFHTSNTKHMAFHTNIPLLILHD